MDEVMHRIFRSRLCWTAGLLFLVQALSLLTFGTAARGPLLSNAIQFALGALAIYAAYRAGQRSGLFGHHVWLQATISIAIWTVAEGIILYYEDILHASVLTRWPSDPLIFFWVVPFFMVLFLRPTSRRKPLDIISLLDFVQVVILAMTAYLAILYVPSKWQAAGSWMARLGWDATNVRDVVLVGGLTARAFLSHARLTRALFRRLAAFLLAYLIADLVFHYVEEVFKVTTGSPWDLLWSAPFVVMIACASTWDRPDEAELANIPVRPGSVRPLLFLSSAFLPLPVLLVAVSVQKETPALGATLVTASLLFSGARLFITQRRRDESELRYRSLVGSSPMPMLVTTPPPEERILLMNHRFTELFGYTLSDVQDVESWWPRAYPNAAQREQVRKEWEHRIAAANAAGLNAIEPLEVEIACRDGSLRHVEVHLTMDGDGALVIFNDITERKLAEEALRERENLLRAIVETEPECVKLTKRDGELILMNPAGLMMIGADSLEQVKGHCVFTLVVPEQRAEYQRLTEEVFEGKRGRLEFEVVGLDGQRRWMETSEAPLCGETGQVTAALGITRDITGRKQAEEALRESEERYRVVAETATDAIFRIDGNSTILYANLAAEKVFGYSVPEMTGQPISMLIPDYLPEVRRAGVIHDLKTGSEHFNRGGVELTGLHQRGKEVPLEVSFGEVAKDGKHTFTCIVRDITERKRTELALTESEARFRALVDDSLTLICTHTMDGTLLTVNPAAAAAWGGAPDELVGKRIQDMLAPSSKEHFGEYMERIRSKTFDSGIIQVLTKAGDKRYWLYRNTLRREAGKEPVVLGSSLDITDFRRSEAERKTIYEIIAAVSTTPNLQELLAAVHLSLSHVLYAENCYIFLCDTTTKECEIPFMVDQLDPVPPPPEAMERTCAAYVYRTGAPMLIGEEEFQRLVDRGDVDLVGAPSPAWLGVPLRGGGEILGVLAVQHYEDPRAYDERDLQFLASVGDQIGLAIQKKRAEEANKQAEANLLAVFDNTQAAIWSLDKNYRLLAFNRSLKESFQFFFGKDADVKVGSALYDLLPADRWPLSKGYYDRALAGERFSVEERIEAQGRVVYVERSYNSIRADGEIIGVSVFQRGITKRKHAEEALRKSEASLAEAQRIALIGSWEWDLVTNREWWSDEMFRIVGLEPGSTTPTFELFMSSVHPDDRKRVVLEAQKAQQEQTSVNVEFRGIRPDGVVRHFQSRAEVMSDVAGNAVRMVGTTQDLTERKLAEESLRQRERDLEEAQRLAKVGSWAFELQSNQLTLSKEHFRILGLDPEGPAPSLEGMGHCYSTESWAQFQEAGRKCFETGEPFEIEGELTPTDGTKRWVVSQGEIERDIHGNSTRFRGTTQDITNRKEVEEELRSSREMFYKAFHSSPEPICILTLAEGRFIDVNKAFTDQLGYARGEVIARTAHDLRLDPLASLNEELSRSSEQGAWHDVEVELFTKTGEARNALISFETAEIGGVPCILAQGRDVTEHRRAEQALRASDERYRAFISQSQDGVWRVELEQPMPVDLPGDEAFEWLFKYGYIAECNDGMARISGLTRGEDLIGKRLGVAVHQEDAKTIESIRSSARKGWQTRTVELKGALRGGMSKTLLRTEVPIIEDGKVKRIWGITRDITELTRAEEALRRSEASLAEAQRIALIGSWDWDMLTNEGRWSDEMFRLVGAAPGSAHPTKAYFLSWVHPDDIEGVNRAGDEALKDQQNYQYEFRVIRADGAVRIFQARAEIIRDAAGNPIRLVGASQDVTERKQAEAKLRVSEARYRTLIEKAPEAIVVVDLDTLKFVDFNENAMHLFGLSREELLKVGPVEASPPIQPGGRPSSEAAAGYLKQAIAGEIPVFDWLHRSAYGKDIPCEVRLVRLPAGEGNLVRGSITDITERKRVEETLLKLKKAVDTSGEVVFMTDLEGVITSVNPEFTRLYGYTGQEVVGKVTPRILKSGVTSLEEHADLWESVLDKRQFQGEIINRTKDGRLVNIETSVSPILGDRGEILGFLAIQRNITDRKRAEDELRASEERYRLLFERSLAGVVRTNREGRILECNEAFVRIVGCASHEEVLSSNASDFYFEGKERRNLIEQLDQRGMVAGVEMRARRKDGTQAWVLLSSSLIENENEGQTILATLFDITHWKELDEQLRQALKMEAVGRLAGGVAHDFNNMLQIINGYSELALDELTEQDPSRGHVQEIKNVVERAAGLTHQLLAFSRQQVLSPRILDLNVSITNLSKMLRRLIGEDIELEIHGGRDLGPVKADLGQIDQVILNLVVNARDAMPKGGKLKIETSNVQLDSSYARGHFPMTPGQYVLISVSDTGKGMDEQTQTRIFEPFFTTKEIGKGTGLGLATVYGIIKQSGGYIWAQSKPGKGTTFNIYLPFAKESTTQPKVKAATAIDGGTETILLVEDEEKVRGLVRRVLQARGYHVLEAPDGREALRVAEGYDGTIHLLLTDVVMPGMSGRQLAGRLERLREGMKTLFMSGYTNEAIIHHGPSDPKSTILQKPFTMDVLSRTVRDVLKNS